MSEIFLSYRRKDAGAAAGRLFDRLADRFGREAIFRDIDTIEAGDDFESSIRSAITRATAVLIVIGPQWIDARDQAGARRLDDPSDYVRREIELALQSNALVIPVLVDDAALPPAERLPELLQALAKRNTAELSLRSWQRDVDELIRQLELRGIPPAETGGASQQSPSIATVRVVTTAIVQFIPNLFTLLRRPRILLGRYGRGRAADVTSAAVFFVLAIVLSLLVLLATYTTTQSIARFGLSVLVAGSLVTFALSFPLWIGWKIAGAARPYAKLLVVLLHQSAVMHVALFVAIAIILVAADLSSYDLVPQVIGELMKPGQPVDALVETMQARIAQLANPSAPAIAAVAATIVLLAGACWLFASWGAYRDAFDAGRAPAAAATLVAIVVVAIAIAGLRWIG